MRMLFVPHGVDEEVALRTQLDDRLADEKDALCFLVQRVKVNATVREQR